MNNAEIINMMRERWPEMDHNKFSNARAEIVIIEAKSLLCITDESNPVYYTILIHAMAHILSESVRTGGVGSLKTEKVGIMTNTFFKSKTSESYFGSSKYGRMFLAICEQQSENNIADGSGSLGLPFVAASNL